MPRVGVLSFKLYAGQPADMALLLPWEIISTGSAVAVEWSNEQDSEGGRQEPGGKRREVAKGWKVRGEVLETSFMIAAVVRSQ